MELGTIKFERPAGEEIWKITSANFSIAPYGGGNKLNIWAH